MKILRVRHGFTTNSSGANEYLPDGGLRVTPDAGAPPARPVLSSVEPWGYAAPVSEPPRSNAMTMGVVFLVVVGAFLAGPLLRVVIRRKKKQAGSRGTGAT